MTDFEILRKRFNQQDQFIDMLRVKVEALESLLKNHIPNFEEQLVKERFKAEQTLNKNILNDG
tara:strand:+ start:1697 stop:1885 length:189 start_codon:yes stop_codon:yes gene_type:complete